ncbi:serine hydrolase [Massilia eurypsychrophila]|uniref:Serine hydrolase n=1 Tax=Massilia eurypsychrophila TaxID=1485217 RepID=A0A2G8TDX5_9BURK|nr:serine hydrolase domain-containing protein [Massilia eurypsychrophila]PIL44255.1 serine hydrolase [Massilia eurypsychrophila]
MRRLVLRFSLSLPLLALSAPFVFAQSAATLDNAVKDALGADFNGVVLVRAPGAAPQMRAYGFADFDKATPNLAATRFQIGSITKWLTSVAVLRLVDQAKLSIDTPVGAYLPQMPAPAAGTVTLRHLLSNTSGIPNGVVQEFRKDPSIAVLKLTKLEATLRFASGAPAFAPGSRFDYSPTNWVVVAAVLESVTGKPFALVLDEQVLRPAGVKATGVPDRPFETLPGGALAYASGADHKPKMSPTVDFVAASGTVFSTAEDLAALAHAVYETALLSPQSRLQLSGILTDENYALGGRVRTMEFAGRSVQVASQAGVTGGFKSLLLHVPGEDKTVIILNNTDMQQSDQARAGEALLRTLYR